MRGARPIPPARRLMLPRQRLGNHRQPRSMPDAIAEAIRSWPHILKSPFSNSFYSLLGKTWDFTPAACRRASDHWNFVARARKHCITDQRIPANHWAICVYGADEVWQVELLLPRRR